MNKLLTVAMGIALSATAFTASAQKAYTEGVATYDMGGMAEAKVSFRGDSSVMDLQQTGATVKTVSFKDEYFAMAMSIPAFNNFKKVAVATPGEIEETTLKLPTYTFTPSTETKVINGFNCKKVVAKDAKGATIDIWVTKDISAPASAVSGGQLFEKAGGFPVQYSVMQMGRSVVFTLKSISGDKVPAGAFGLPKGYDRVSMTDLFSSLMGGRR